VLDAARYGLGNEEVQLRGLFFGLDKEKASVSEIVDALKKTYCSSVGVEFTHVENPEEQVWLARRFEAEMNRSKDTLPAEDKKRILSLLQTSEEFDHFLHTKFRGPSAHSAAAAAAATNALRTPRCVVLTLWCACVCSTAVKRYGLEGCESMMTCMDTIFSKAAESSFDEARLAHAPRSSLPPRSHTSRLHCHVTRAYERTHVRSLSLSLSLNETGCDRDAAQRPTQLLDRHPPLSRLQDLRQGA
jgi:hypothetical protein